MIQVFSMSLIHPSAASSRNRLDRIMTMTKIVSAIGLCIGIVVLSLAYFNAQGPVQAQENGACSVKEVALDEGYGVTRKEIRAVCGDAR
jgi:hypothetical protein